MLEGKLRPYHPEWMSNVVFAEIVFGHSHANLTLVTLAALHDSLGKPSFIRNSNVTEAYLGQSAPSSFCDATSHPHYQPHILGMSPLG